MSTAAATADAAAPKKGSKKLIIIIAAAVLVLVLGGGVAAMLLSKKSAAQDEDAESAEGEAPVAAVSRHDAGTPPTFVPLEPFTVNLADRETERYAQVGITLEVADAKLGDQIKLYMPAVRNNILMALADKTAAQLMDREGKKLLADQVMRETSRALGYDVEEPEAEPEDEEAPRKKKRKKAPAPALPVTAVHFSNFIIQ